MIRNVVYIFLMLTIAAAGLAQEKTPADVDSITLDELKGHLHFLASDALGGRALKTPGYRIAADYAASQFRSAGVMSIIKDAESNDTYLQTVKLVERALKYKGKIAVSNQNGTFEFNHDESVMFFEMGDMSLLKDVTEIVFVGYGIEEPDHGWNDYERLDLEGKVVLLMAGAPTEDGEPVLQDELHEKYNPLSGLRFKSQSIYARDAAAILILRHGEHADSLGRMRDRVGDKSFTLDSDDFAQHYLLIPAGVIEESLTEKLLEGQKFNPFKTMDGYGAYELQDVRLNIEFENVDDILIEIECFQRFHGNHSNIHAIEQNLIGWVLAFNPPS